MAEPEDRIVPLLRNAGVMDMPLVERTRWTTEELGRRFCAGRVLESFATIERADALISRLVTVEFQERFEALERRVSELEAAK